MGRHRRSRRLPVRTGLLGASAAMAVGAVAVASGLLPGGDTFTVSGGDAAEQVRTEGSARLQTQGDTSSEPTNEASKSASPTAQRPHAPSKSPSGTPAKPSKTPAKASKTPDKPKATPSKTASSKPAKPTKAPAPPKQEERKAEEKKESAAPSRTQTRAPERAPKRPAAPSSSAADDAEATVLSMVNAERAKVGCSPVTADPELADLAGDFSADMAARGFFDHTDPDGATPWDRAEKAGVTGLGGENIARGQADADAVMNAWMNSDGHRANILNCSYKTLGVGVHMGPGGPWWTQDFGF
ncbi:CAP domain-containing protein [Streptomyces sp. NPDC051907]|uniref:CAP domain-containing protein n=1 Tax=Streptomyces sp. NPDC051907 TaxID=3155284 RepID=UPI0034422FFC